MDDEVLFDRFHAVPEITPPAGAFDRLKGKLLAARVRPQPRSWFSPALSPAVLRLVAAATVAAVAIAAIGGFIALRNYAHRTIPVQVAPFTASGTCFQGFHMVDATTGWRSAGSHTHDGGVTWQGGGPPGLPNQTKGGFGECILDGQHAWTTEAIGTGASKTAPPQATQLVVMLTNDGGLTWQKGGSVPASGLNAGATFEFVDDHHGWLLVDSGGVRALFSTADGGFHWSAVTSGSSLDRLAAGCSETAMTFLSSERGWLTWDCSRSNGPTPSSPSGAVVAGTNDGGRTWAPVDLPSFPSGSDYTCGASAPVFSAAQGLLAMSCGGVGHNGWTGTYRSTDGGNTWAVGQFTFGFFQLDHVSLVNGTIAYALSGTKSDDLYRTTDAGRDWSLVKKSIFSGQGGSPFQFLDIKVGFAFTATSQGVPWKTTDGGLTWSLSGVRTLPGNIGCPSVPDGRSPTAPEPILMTGAGGWAIGGLHTVDGGLHWSAGAPSATGRTLGNAEFFLDATHAWVAEAAGSSTACADHILIFSTSDGGKTWQQSATVPVSVSTPSDSIWSGTSTSFSRTNPILSQSYVNPEKGPWIDFVDARDGWLLVETQPASFDGMPKVGPLYRTTDGGAHWTVVATDPAAGEGCTTEGGISFATATTGFMPAPTCAAGEPLAYRVTHDGGVSWTDLKLGLNCGCDGSSPAWFDGRHGLTTTGDTLLTTSDGGQSWSIHSLPLTFGMPAIDFIDPNHGWLVVADQSNTFSLMRTTDGGKTWSTVNSHLPAGDQNSPLASTLTFVDANHAYWATGSALYSTTDAGRTWTALPTSVA